MVENKWFCWVGVSEQVEKCYWLVDAKLLIKGVGLMINEAYVEFWGEHKNNEITHYPLFIHISNQKWFFSAEIYIMYELP